MVNEPTKPDRRSGKTDRTPPGDFTSEELQEDTARFLDELRRRAVEKERRAALKKPGPPPAEPS